MRRVVCAAILALAGAPGTGHAQLSEHAVELFGSVGGIAGITPVRITSASHAGVHAGFLLDAGIQGERLAIAPVLRLWELYPTQSYGGRGGDVMLRSEWRAARDAATTVRVAAGAGFDEIDGGRGPDREHTGTQGFIWSAGLARELFAPSGALIVLSADLVMPHVNPDLDGRRKPIVELGFAYRSRFFQSIRLPSPGRR